MDGRVVGDIIEDAGEDEVILEFVYGSGGCKILV